MKEIVAWETNDGKRFLNIDEANLHAARLSLTEWAESVSFCFHSDNTQDEVLDQIVENAESLLLALAPLVPGFVVAPKPSSLRHA